MIRVSRGVTRGAVTTEHEVANSSYGAGVHAGVKAVGCDVRHRRCRRGSGRSRVGCSLWLWGLKVAWHSIRGQTSEAADFTRSGRGPSNNLSSTSLLPSDPLDWAAVACAGCAQALNCSARRKMSSIDAASGPLVAACATLTDIAARSLPSSSPPSPVTTPAFPPLIAPGLSVLTSYSPTPAPIVRTQSAASPPAVHAAVDPADTTLAASDGSDGQRTEQTAIDVGEAVSPAHSAEAAISYLSSPISSPATTSPLQLTISLASPATATDSLAPPAATSSATSTSSSHLIDIPSSIAPHSPPLSHSNSREHSMSLSHQRPSISVRRLSVSQRAAGPTGRSQEDEEEVRWLTQANPFDVAALEAAKNAQHSDEQKDTEVEEDEVDAYGAAEAEEKEEVESYEEMKAPLSSTQPQSPPQAIIQPIHQSSLLPPTAYGTQRVIPSQTSPPQRPSSHHVSRHISLSYDPRSSDPSPSHSSIPLSPSLTPSLSAATSVHSELPPSPALVSRPLIVDEVEEHKSSATPSLPPQTVSASAIHVALPKASPADRRRLQRKIGFALAEHDEEDDEEEEVKVRAELRPVKPTRRTAKQREAERKEKERRKRQQERDVLDARERRFLARDIQERIGSFPRPLLQAVLSCLLTSPPVATLSNLSSTYALTSGQHVLLDLSGLAEHWSSGQSSFPDELAHGLGVLLGVKAGVLVCDERTTIRDLMYGRKEQDEREEKYRAGGGNGGRGSVLSIASIVSSSSTSSPASPNGPLFCPLVVLHNLHLAPHWLHSTLISAGRLGSVTIEGSVVRLPRPSLLVATHSQHTGGGLWCGGGGFSARQLMELFMYDVMAESTFPSQLRAYLAQQPPMPPILSSRTALDYGVLLPSLQSVTCSQLIHQYVHDLIATLRQHVRVAFGPSPSTAHSLLCAASTHALFSGEGYVTPHDVDVVAAAVLAHRISLRMTGGSGVGRGVVGGGVGVAGSARAIVQHLVTKVLVPPK